MSQEQGKNNTPSGRIAKISLTGKTPQKWHDLKSKLMSKLTQAIDTSLDTIVNPVTQTTLEDELKNLTLGMLNYSKAKLAEPGINNQKTIAEIEEIYARKSGELALARKNNAEADAIKFSLKVKELKLALGFTKMFLLGEKDEESIFFLKQIEEFIKLLNDIEPIK